MPEIVQFKNGNQIKNLYNASGQKLKSEFYTVAYPTVIPVNTIGNPGNPDNCGEVTLTGTHYLGNIEYSFSVDCGDHQFDLDKIYNSEGYCDLLFVNGGPNYQYYRKDHLGNNREVWNANGNVTYQRTQYYPSGLPWAESTNTWVQNKKYNGKEFIEAHGYDMYDYGARGYYVAIGRFSTIDPLAGISFNLSPYVYCNNNPVRYIDPTGMSTFVGPTGEVIEHRKDFDVFIYYVNDVEKWEKNGKKKDDLLIIGIENPNRKYNKGEHWLFWNGEISNMKTEKTDKLPSTYGYCNGEKVIVNGNTYQLHNNHWVKLTGEMVDVAALGGKTSAGVYIPNQANFVDRAIYEDNMKLLIKKGTDGIIPGLVIEGVAAKTTPKASGYALILQFYYNMFNGMFNQLEENSYHDSQVKQLKSEEKK